MGDNFADKDSNTRWSGTLAYINGFDERSVRLEHLDAIVVISYQDVVIRINKEVVGIRKLTNTEMTNEIALGIKNGNATFVALANDYNPIRQNADAHGSREFSL